MTNALFYPFYIFVGTLLTLLLIPKRDYKEYFLYGFLIGGLGDIVVVLLFQNVFHIIQFKESGIFNVLGLNFLSPPSWVITVMLFLRFLPERSVFLYLYIFTFGLFSVSYGYIVHNVGLFDFKPWFYPFFSFLTFLSWWSFTAWVFKRTSNMTKIKSSTKP